MSIRITDCTIRDGGYLFNKNPDPVFVRGIMKGLADAGIDFVETGFLQTDVTGDTLVYADTPDSVITAVTVRIILTHMMDRLLNGSASHLPCMRLMKL